MKIICEQLGPGSLHPCWCGSTAVPVADSKFGSLAGRGAGPVVFPRLMSRPDHRN